MKSEWIMCPICGNKTRDKIREDTELKNFPLYCPKCKQESLIDANNCHQRARRKDAEPMKLRNVSQFIGSVTTFMLDFIVCHRG